MRTNELILYRYMEHEDLLRDMTFLIDNADNDYYNKEDLKSLLFENLKGAFSYGCFFRLSDGR